MDDLTGVVIDPDVDHENLMITFSVASSQPFTREDDDGREYDEVLEISDEAINFERLNAGASVLKNHDDSKTVGVVVRAWVQGGKLAIRAQFRQNDPDSVAVFNDAAAGTLPNVSIGYMQDRIDFAYSEERLIGYVKRWTPFECSVGVGVPADHTVGFYRSLTRKGQKSMDGKEKENGTGCDDQEKRIADLEGEVKALKSKLKEMGVDDEGAENGDDASGGKNDEGAENGDDASEDEADEIRALGIRLNIRSLAESAIKSGKNLEEFKRMAKSQQVKTPARGFVVREQRRYSVVNAIRSLLDPENPEFRFERGVSDELYRSMGLASSPRLPSVMIDFTRAFDGSVSGGGAALIGTDHRSDLFIEMLRKRLAAKNIRIITGLRNNIEIPRQTSGGTVTEKTLDQDVDETAPGTDSIEMSPRKFGAWTKIGQDLLVQGSPDAVNLVLEDLLDASAQKLNADIFAKLNNTTGVGTVEMAIASATWKDMLKFNAAIANYAVSTAPTFVMNGGNMQHFKGVSKDTGSGRFICEDGKIDGFDVEIGGNLTDAQLYFGDWSNVLMGQWGNGLEIMIDPYTLATSQKLRIIMNVLADTAIRIPQLFVKRVDPVPAG